MRIKITADHINRGKQQRTCQCPVAIAILETTGIRYEVYKTFMQPLDNRERRIMNSPAVVQFISDFDAGRPCKPFAFTLSHRVKHRIAIEPANPKTASSKSI